MLVIPGHKSGGQKARDTALGRTGRRPDGRLLCMGPDLSPQPTNKDRAPNAELGSRK